MTDTEYADLVLEEKAAREAWIKDPGSVAKFDRWYQASFSRHQELQARQKREHLSKCPPVQLTRKPEGSDTSQKAQLDEAGFGSFGPM
jgi:hypothetical protein